MSYDLTPKKKDVEELRIGAFTWPIMLQETGMGYILGYGKNITPGSYVYQQGNYGSPVSNDGYKVTAFEAKAMAKAARGYISVKKFINNQYDEISKEKRNQYESYKDLYIQPTGVDFLNAIEEFADFAEKSGGFTIN